PPTTMAQESVVVEFKGDKIATPVTASGCDELTTRWTVGFAVAHNLRERFDGAPVAVCLELSQGPVVSAPLEHDFFVGVAPVNVRSRTSHRVLWRWACPKFQRQTFIEWASQTVPKSFLGKNLLREAEGARRIKQPHNAAIRALAFKWIRILWRCWVEQTPCDESRYLSALRKHHSPLLNFKAQTRN